MEPLRHGELAILLALSRGDAHGYQIRAHLAPILPMALPTLYKTLHRLAKHGRIEEVGIIQGSHGGLPQRRYRLTDAGRRLVSVEVDRMRSLLDLAVIVDAAERQAA